MKKKGESLDHSFNRSDLTVQFIWTVSVAEKIIKFNNSDIVIVLALFYIFCPNLSQLPRSSFQVITISAGYFVITVSCSDC